MKHKYLDCAPDYKCRDSWGSCRYYDGGLLLCLVYNGAESGLTTECSGVRMTEEQEDAVYRTGTLDFKDGKWYNPKEKYESQ